MLAVRTGGLGFEGGRRGTVRIVKNEKVSNEADSSVPYAENVVYHDLRCNFAADARGSIQEIPPIGSGTRGGFRLVTIF
jgi:hypothetical protein